jgi:hypothetical protein
MTEGQVENDRTSEILRWRLGPTGPLKKSGLKKTVLLHLCLSTDHGTQQQLCPRWLGPSYCVEAASPTDCELQRPALA